MCMQYVHICIAIFPIYYNQLLFISCEYTLIYITINVFYQVLCNKMIYCQIHLIQSIVFIYRICVMV